MSSGSTQRVGKGGTRDRGNKTPTTSAQSAKTASVSDGHAKSPDGFNPKVQPTPEQIRLAQIINDSSKTDDPDIQRKVQQVMEVTGETSDAVVVALHDCDNDTTRAINMLLEGNQQEGEWETTGKKKKQREVVQKGPEAATGNKENRGRGEGPTRSRGGPRSQGPPRSWKNRESEKNERNLEDGREGRPRGGPRRGRGGRGGGAGGGRGSRTFQNRGYGSEGNFPRAMDTWTNSAPESTQHGGDTMTVGNWNNDFTASEDWSEEDWTGQLETKVFTPSGQAAAVATTVTPTIQPNVEEAPTATGVADVSSGVSIMQLLKSGAEAAQGASPAPTQQQTPTPYSVAQYNQQATESIKAAVGMGSSVPYSLAAAGSAAVFNCVTTTSNEASMASTASKVGPSPTAVALPPRPKMAKVRVPPPSKIPESAVEMPDDTVTSLEVQFGGLEFGADTFDFTATSDSIATSSQQPAMSSSAFVDGHSGSKNSASSNPPSLPPPQQAQQTPVPSQAAQPQQQSLSQHSKESNATAQGLGVLSGSRPPGIPAQAQGPAPRKEMSAPVTSMMGQNSSAPSTQKVNSVMSVEHMLLQSSQHIPERSKPANVSASSKMYGAAPQRSSQGLEGASLGGSSTVGVKASVSEQPMYSSAGGHPYGAASSGVSYQGVPKGLGGGVYAPLAQNYASSVATTQHYYPQQPASAFGQQQSNGYQTPYQSNAYVPSAQPSGYGVSSKLSSTLSGHSVKDSVLDATQPSNVQHGYEGSHSSSGVSGVLQAGATPALATTASSLAGATATTSVLKNSMSASKTLPNMPPGVPAAAMLGPQYVMGNVPFYGLQQPVYSYEDLQLLQSRMPPLGYYDMQFQVPTSITGRDLGLNNMAYADTKFNRGESSDGSPAGASQGGQQGGASGQGSGQGTGPGHQQAFLNALPPGYGYYFHGGMMPPGSLHPYAPAQPIFPVPPATNAHGPTTSGQFQKANAYSSHSFASGGYESLTQTQDYTKGAYGAGSQGQAKGIPGSFF